MLETQEMLVWSLGLEDPLEQEIAIHASVRAWEIPWTEDPGGLQSMGLQRVGYDWATEQTYILVSGDYKCFFFSQGDSNTHIISIFTDSFGGLSISQDNTYANIN